MSRALPWCLRPLISPSRPFAGAWLALLLGVAAAGPARAQGGDRRHDYIETHWQIEDGLPQSSVNGLAQTPDGFLWLSTQEGLARFDGLQFQVHNARNGFPCSWAGPLLPLEDNGLWVGTNDCGLVRFHTDGRIESFRLQPNLSQDRVSVLAHATGDGVWIGTDHGLAVLRAGKLSWVPALQEAAIRSLTVAPDGALWVGTQGEVFELRGERIAHSFGLAAGVPVGDVLGLRFDRLGQLWAAGSSRIGRLRGDRFEPAGLGDALDGDVITSLAQGHHQKLWVGTRNGRVGTLTAQGIQFEPQVAATSAVVALLEGEEETLWVGTQLEGLHRFTPPRVHPWGAPEGIVPDKIWSVYEDPQGGVWAGSGEGTVSRIQQGQVRTLGPAQGLPRAAVYSMFQDELHRMWVGTEAGLYREAEGRFEQLTLPGRAPDLTIYSLLPTPEGLYVTTKRGVFLWKDDRFSISATPPGTHELAYDALLRDPDGSLWTGSENSVEHWLHGKRILFGPEHGVRGTVTAFAHDGKGGIWVGTTQGLVHLSGNGSARITEKEGLADDTILALVMDGLGNLWMSSNHGISSVRTADLDALMAGELKRVASLHYGRADGMRSLECNSFSNASSLRTRSGHLWFPSLRGAVELDPAALLKAAPPVLPVLDEVLVEGEPAPSTGVLPAGSRDVEFRYTAAVPSLSEGVMFRYRLEGYDPTWIEAGPRRVAYYTNLGPGAYRFRVSARRPGSAWTELAAPAEIRLQAFFYQTLWFYLALAGLTILAVVGTVNLRIRSLARRERLLRVRVAERTEALSQSLARSAHAEKSLRTVLDRLPEAVVVWRDGKVIFANGPAVDMVGDSQTQRLVELAVDPSVPPTVGPQEFLARAVDTTLTHEAAFTRADGTLATLEGCALVASFENAPAVVAVVRDVTERKQMQSRLLLADRMMSVGTLAAGVAHEINNPLAFISSNIAFVQEELKALRTSRAPASEADLQEYETALSEALLGSQRVRLIVRDLKAFSRSDEETVGPVELKTTLETALKMAANEIRHRARLTVDFGDAGWVEGNEARLGQVFLNLLVNAAQSISEGMVERNEIRVTVRNQGPSWVISITDTGAGIPASLLTRIFDPFFTTKPVGVGTGLGLSICHGIIKNMGGQLEVQSELGKGSTFRVVLPGCESPAVSEAALPATELRSRLSIHS